MSSRNKSKAALVPVSQKANLRANPKANSKPNQGRNPKSTNAPVQAGVTRKRNASPHPQERALKKGKTGARRQSNVIRSDSESADEEPQRLREDDAESLSSVVIGDDLGVDDDDDLNELEGSNLRDALFAERARWSKNKEQDSPSEDEGDDQPQVADRDESSSDREDPPPDSHRAIQRRAERPKWQAAAKVDKKPSQTLARNDPDVNLGWGEEAHYNPLKPRARMIGINDQPPQFRAVLKDAIKIRVGDALFICSFPDVGSTYRDHRKSMKSVAKVLNYPVLADRLGKDLVMGQEGGRVIHHRIGLMRGKAKAAIASLVGTHYGIEALGTVIERRELVKTLLDAADYSYPRDESGGIVDTKPYYHKCIVAGIQKFFFTGSRVGSYEQRYRKRMKSSLSDYAGELELPFALVALIATAIHATLQDWSTGVHIPTDFNSDLLEDTYNEHHTFLKDMCTDTPGRYHVLMHGLYTLCSSGTQATVPAVSIAERQRRILNVDAMEDVVPIGSAGN